MQTFGSLCTKHVKHFGRLTCCTVLNHFADLNLICYVLQWTRVFPRKTTSFCLLTIYVIGLLMVFENDCLTIVFCFVIQSFSKTIVSFSKKNIVKKTTHSFWTFRRDGVGVGGLNILRTNSNPNGVQCKSSFMFLSPAAA